VCFSPRIWLGRGIFWSYEIHVRYCQQCRLRTRRCYGNPHAFLPSSVLYRWRFSWESNALSLSCVKMNGRWRIILYHLLSSSDAVCERGVERGGVLSKLWAPRCDFAARKIQFFPYTHLSMTSHLISHNLWKTSSQLHITFNNGGGWLTVNHVFGFLGIPTQ